MAAPVVGITYSGSVTYVAADGIAPPAISFGGIPIVVGKSVVVYSIRDSDNEQRERRHTWGYDLTTTTIAFSRNQSSSAKSVTIDWEVTYFSAGVNVQRGVLDLTSTLQTVSINEVDSAKSIINIAGFVTSSNSGKEMFQAGIVFSTDVSGDDQLTFTRSSAPTSGQSVHYWQVIEFDQDVSIQRGITTLSASGTNSISILAVDLGATFVTVEGMELRHSSSPTVRNNYLTNITSSTNLDVSNIYLGSSATAIINWCVVEFTGGQTVESGVALFDDTTRPDITRNNIRHRCFSTNKAFCSLIKWHYGHRHRKEC